MTRTLLPRPAVASVALVAALALGGCSGGGDEPAPDPSPSATAPSVDASDAPIQVAEDGLPTDFPRDEVPIITGDIVSVTVPRGEGSPPLTSSCWPTRGRAGSRRWQTRSAS